MNNLTVIEDVYHLNRMLCTNNGVLPQTQLKEMYDDKQWAKLSVYFQFNHGPVWLQEKILKDNNMKMIGVFCQKWHFHPDTHKLLRKASLEIQEIAFEKTKLTDEEEVNMAKKESKEKVIIYLKWLFIRDLKLCKKAQHIIDDVRKLSIFG